MQFQKKIKKVVCQLIYLSVCLILFISLVSFNYDDLSFIFESSEVYAPKNLLGHPGALIASFLLYFWGSSAFLFCFLLAYLMYASYNNTKAELDRVIGICILPFITATILYGRNLDFFSEIFAGGFFGYVFYSVLSSVMEKWQLNLFLNCLLLSDLIIIVRFDWLFKLKSVTKKMNFIYDYLSDARKQIRSTYIKMKNSFIRKRHVPAPNVSFDLPVIKRIEDKKESEAVSPDYVLPGASFFEQKKTAEVDNRLKEGDERAKLLEEKLACFGINGYIKSIIKGPVVTLYEYEPTIDTKISKIIARENDLALALQAVSLRIIAPIPGKSVVGFEVSNSVRKPVNFADIIHSKTFENFNGTLPLILGKCTVGNEVIVDLAKMPHLLVAGSTGSGKSVALNCMLMSLLCKLTPDELKLILIDPKRLEFAAYSDISHLLFPIITDPALAISALSYAVELMEYRYRLMAETNVKNIAEYQKLGTEFEQMPYLVIIIDELADLMMRAGKDVEILITRLSQMARAAGIHLIVATQRPSVDVITGLIKVNFPSRIAFKVTSKIDSRTIIDCAGADKLLGKGDMLFLDSSGLLKRLHGALVTDSEIENAVEFIKSQREVIYEELVCTAPDEEEISADDEILLAQVIQYLQSVDEISISLLQRKFRIGYNKSARLIDLLELKGHVAPSGSGKRRKVIKFENS